MANPIIGYVRCPICGYEWAWVRRQNNRHKFLYYCCYEANGDGRCRTIQCTGPTGQEYIKNNMRALDVSQQEEAANDAAYEAAEDQREAARAARRQVHKRGNLVDMAARFRMPEGEDDQ